MVKEKFEERFGIIKYNDRFYKTYAVFGKDCYCSSRDINALIKNRKEDGQNKQINKFYVPSKNANHNLIKAEDLQKEFIECNNAIKKETITQILKDRYYLKVFKPNIKYNKNEKILTFILFNSSYANQFKIDPTIQNCAYLTFKNGYNGFEIFNLFSIRNSVNKLGDSAKCDDNIKFIAKMLSERKNPEIIFAWGYGKGNDYQKRIGLLLENLKNIRNTKQIIIKGDNDRKMMHPGNQSWNARKKPFKKNAEIDNVQ